LIINKNKVFYFSEKYGWRLVTYACNGDYRPKTACRADNGTLLAAGIYEKAEMGSFVLAENVETLSGG